MISTTIMEGDCVRIMSELEPSSIDLVVTSPPYDSLRTYDGHAEWSFQDCAVHLTKLLKPGGVICWNIGDSVIKGSESTTSCKQKIFFNEMCGLNIHDTMIYAKSNFCHPEKNRYHQLFEYVFILSKGKPKTFNPIRDKKNKWAGTGTWGRNSVREANGEMSIRKRNLITEYGMRGNVWHGKTSGQERGTSGSIHPAKMPLWLANDLIVSWSNEGDFVLDPFAGSGTTGVAARNLNRNSVLIDIHPGYCKIMRQEFSQ